MGTQITRAPDGEYDPYARIQAMNSKTGKPCPPIDKARINIDDRRTMKWVEINIEKRGAHILSTETGDNFGRVFFGRV